MGSGSHDENKLNEIHSQWKFLGLTQNKKGALKPCFSTPSSLLRLIN